MKSTSSRIPRFECLETRKVLNGSPDFGAALARLTANGLELGVGDSVQSMEVHWPDETARREWAPALAADFNGDGSVDLYGERDASAWVLLNDGQQLFLLPWGDGLNGARLLGTGDVNADGLTDLIGVVEPFSSASSARLVVAVNDANGGFSTTIWSDAPSNNFERLFVADFDGDGRIDVLGGHNERWRLATSNGDGFALQDWGPAPEFDWQNVIMGDFDGDQFEDLAARGKDHTWWVWRGTATGLLPAKYWGHWKNASQDEWFDVRTEDLNADGLDDLIGRAGDGTLWVGTSVQKEFHSWRWATGWGKGGNWQNIVTADMTGDGLLDQVGQAGDGTWWIAENTGRQFKNSFLDRNPQVSFAMAEGGLSSDPLPVFNSVPKVATQSRGPDPEMSALGVSFNDTGELTVTGGGQKLRAIELRSASGSLVPPTDPPEMFGEPVVAERTQIRFEFAEPVTVDEAMTLGVRWLETSTATDLRVVYDAVEVEAVVDKQIFASLPANQIAADKNVAHFYDSFADPEYAADKVVPEGPNAEADVSVDDAEREQGEQQGGGELSRPADPVAEEPVSEDSVSEDSVSEDSVSEDSVSEDSVSEEPVAEEPVSEDSGSCFGRLCFGRLCFGRLCFGRLCFGRLCFGRLCFGRLCFLFRSPRCRRSGCRRTTADRIG